MASRHADSSRSNRYDERDRGGSRSYAPRRDEYRRSDRRDDRRDDRDDRRGSRRDDRRDDRRDRDNYVPPRRSRSPRRDRDRDRDELRDRRDRSRDRGRYQDDRYRDDRRRDDRARGRDHYERDRDDRRRDERRDGDARNRRSTSIASVSGVKRDRDTRDKTAEPSKEDSKLAKLKAWKEKMAAKAATGSGNHIGETSAPITQASTPAPATPATPAATAASPEKPTPTPEAVPVKAPNKTASAKPKQKIAKPAFKLDDLASAKGPQPSTLPVQSNGVSKAFQKTNATPAKPLKASGNMSSFGLKAKTKADNGAAKNALSDDEGETKKRTLQHLPEFKPEDEPMLDADVDDADVGDIGSDDEDAAQAARAAVERRREQFANNEDTTMEEAPAAVQNDEDDDEDELDKFMSGLNEPEIDTLRLPSQAQAVYGDENEVTMTAVNDEDFLAMEALRKKKREVPVIDHKKVEYEPFRKNFYTEPAEIKEMTAEEVADRRLELDGIKVRGNIKACPNPVEKWPQMGLLQSTLDVLNELGYTKPTSIQAQAIPIAESGLDMIGVAKTGSGKTLAFGLPLVRHILDQPKLRAADGPIVLILAPTRELAVQIVKELKPFLKANNLKASCAYGGAPIKDQIADIKRGGIHVLCATPGRLIDLLTSNSGRVLSFKRITYVVLDEADRMFDMGFEPQVMKILANTRPDRQTVLFSATFPKNIGSLAKKILDKPVEIIVGGRSVVAPEIKQVIEVITEGPAQKMNNLLRHFGNLFDQDDDARALVFVERQETADDLLDKIMKKGYPCNAIHGGKEQIDRTDAINDFKNGALPVLIATSVAARGLDIAQLKLVINYDCPTHLEDYVHRCGRTGRAGNTGTAVTFIENPAQERYAPHLVKALTQSGQPVADELKDMSNNFLKKVNEGKEKWYGGGFGGHGLDRLEQARELEKRREKRAHKMGDEPDEEDDVEMFPPIVKANAAAKTESAKPAQTGSASRSPSPEDEPMPAYMKNLEGPVIVKKYEKPAADTSKTLTLMDRVKLAASGVDGRLSKKGTIHHGQPIDNKGPDAGAFHSTIEINDFPQKARWAVTNRTNVAKILDATGTSITTKGTFYPAGKEPGENELPKLYILVEGETENVVVSAMRELQRLLRDGTMAAAAGDTGARSGRYNVLS